VLVLRRRDFAVFPPEQPDVKIGGFDLAKRSLPDAMLPRVAIHLEEPASDVTSLQQALYYPAFVGKFLHA